MSFLISLTKVLLSCALVTVRGGILKGPFTLHDIVSGQYISALAVFFSSQRKQFGHNLSVFSYIFLWLIIS
ncbi:hypothetical protein THOG05_60157 [Vibrio rotiferianus]|nr:hypothetical protein THOG05_60157 [Vibrio rotiferianus]